MYPQVSQIASRVPPLELSDSVGKAADLLRSTACRAAPVGINGHVMGLVTADEIPDPGKLTLTTRLNGQQVQHSGTDKLIYSCQQIVSFCSDFTELHPGDVIATGTPEGVGHSRKPPLWMKPGDLLEVEISNIGVLRTRIVDEK